MSQKLYKILQHLIPELKQHPPVEGADFEDFSAWINHDNEFLHYIEIKEYFDNGIEDNYYFKKFNVNAEQLQSEIEQDIERLFAQFEDGFEMDSQENFEDALDVAGDIMQQTESIIFDKIQAAASAHALSLLVVYREHPYWLLLPTKNEYQLNLLVDAFNQAFHQQGDLNMAIYEPSTR